jgi:hypothetical protein
VFDENKYTLYETAKFCLTEGNVQLLSSAMLKDGKPPEIKQPKYKVDTK